MLQSDCDARRCGWQVIGASTSSTTTSITPRAGTDLAQVKIETPENAPAADPIAEHKAVKKQLRLFEIEFEKKNGFRPRKRNEWGDMWPLYERYAVLRKQATETKMSEQSILNLGTRRSSKQPNEPT